ncbi:MAG: hypothetical protein LBR27_02360 [Bifidobacteriaceae bacterium]|jgi:hypothetical protein|nr:hypothetical protein [Bifidobacteriaceae bacterium]
MRKLLIGTAAVAAALLLAGCTSPSQKIDQSQSPTSTATGDDLPDDASPPPSIADIASGGATPEGKAEGLKGTLDLTGDCVTVIQADGSVVVPLFAAGIATYDQPWGEIVLPGVREGDESRIHLGTAVNLWGVATATAPDGAVVPDSCKDIDATYFSVADERP